ncbi:MAG: hypothetical protein FJZ57_02760 [Chlamydiae bacterium]|nr:hypothetical protein [Chlamydiota bacterium]
MNPINFFESSVLNYTPVTSLSSGSISRIVKVALGSILFACVASRFRLGEDTKIAQLAKDESSVFMKIPSFRGVLGAKTTTYGIDEKFCPLISSAGVHTAESPVLQSRKSELELLNDSKYSEVFEQLQSFIYYSDYEQDGQSFRLRTLNVSAKEWGLVQKKSEEVFSDYISKYKNFGCTEKNIIEITPSVEDSNCVDRIFSKDGTTIAHAKATNHTVCYGDNCYLNGLVYLHEIMHVEEGYMYAQLRELLPTLKQMILTYSVARNLLDENTLSIQKFPQIKMGMRSYDYKEFVSFYENLESVSGNLANALVSEESIEYLTGCNYNFLEMVSKADFNFLQRNLDEFHYFSESTGIDIDDYSSFYIANLRKIPFFSRLYFLLSNSDEESIDLVETQLYYETSNDYLALSILRQMYSKSKEDVLSSIDGFHLDPHKSLLAQVVRTIVFSDPQSATTSCIKLLTSFSDNQMNTVALKKSLLIESDVHKSEALAVVFNQAGSRYFELVVSALHSLKGDHQRLLLLKVVTSVQHTDRKDVLQIILKSIDYEQSKAVDIILSNGCKECVQAMLDIFSSSASQNQKMEFCEALSARKDNFSKKLLEKIIEPFQLSLSRRYICSKVFHSRLQEALDPESLDN